MTMSLAKKLAIALLMTFMAGGLIACDNKGPAEKAGESIDESAESAGESMEDLGENIEDAAED